VDCSEGCPTAAVMFGAARRQALHGLGDGALKSDELRGHVDAASAGRLQDRGYRIVGRGVENHVGAVLTGPLQLLGPDVDGHHQGGAHEPGQLDGL